MMALNLALKERPCLDDAVAVTPYGGKGGFPLFVQPSDPRLRDEPDAARDWFDRNRELVEAMLLDAGAVVFRGFAVRTTHEFSNLMGAYYEPRRLGYAGGAAARAQLADQVYETSKSGPAAVITMHQEMMYDPAPPSRICFFCHVPSVSGGETFLGDMREVTAALPVKLVEAADKRGVRYQRNYRDPGSFTGNSYLDMVLHRDWQSAFSTTDRDQAIETCRAMELEARFLPDGSLSTSYTGPGLADHPVTGERFWFNGLATNTMRPQTIGAENYAALVECYGDKRPVPYLTTFGDGEPASPEDLEALDSVLDRLKVAFPWSSGDMLLIDNYRTAHGRNWFTGLRDIQVALFQ